MARVTASQATSKWVSRIQGAQQQITDGVNAVSVAPGVSAAKQKALWLQRVTASADKWASNVAAVPLDVWKSKMVEVGIPRISSGATANQGKVEDFFNQYLPYLDAGKARIDAMPKGTLQNGIDRAIAQIQYNAAFRRR